MKVVSVNVGKVQIQPWRDGTPSAIHKLAVSGRVDVGLLGLAGDEQADTKNHGGEDKAVFVMPESNYALFNIDQPFGFLGENLTLSGVDETEICLGDRLQIGTVLLEVSQSRSPCWKLGQHVSDPRYGSDWTSTGFLKAYSESGRVGFYCRVLATGALEKGQPVTWLTRNTESEAGEEAQDDSVRNGLEKNSLIKITVQELFLAQQFHATAKEREDLKLVVQHPALSASWKKKLTNLIATF